MDPIVTSALITTAGLIVVALIGWAQVVALRGISHNTNSMTERLEALQGAAGERRGADRANEAAAIAAENVEVGRQQVKDENPPADAGEIDIDDVEAIKVKK